MNRRELLRIAASLGVAGVAGRTLTACAPSTGPAAGPATDGSTTAPGSTSGTVPHGYGPLGPPDANGVRLPPGFTSRVVATSGQRVGDTDYVWHANPDGGACFAAPDGGWIYVSNSESAPDKGGGASLLRFAPDGSIAEARRILGDTALNCAGGATPWGTWLSCEEHPQGRVHESYPLEARPAQARPALGVFPHEAVAVDEETRSLFLTEDQPDGALYRFRPTAYPDLSAGTLEVLTEAGTTLAWTAVPDPSAATTPTRQQVADTKRFNGGEGICVDAGSVFFTTKGDNRVWRYTIASNELGVVYDAATSATPLLTGVDNITADDGSLFVAEDGGDLQVVQVFGTTVAPVAQIVGVTGSEITGPAFDPAGTRLYFSSQRNPGTTYEITGPWSTRGTG